MFKLPVDKRYTGLILKVILALLGFLLFYALIKYALPVLAPFLVAAAVALVNEPVVELLEKRARLPRKLASLISLIASIAIISTALVFCTSEIYDELNKLKDNIASYIKTVSVSLSDYMSQASAYYKSLPWGISDIIDRNISGMTAAVENSVTDITSYLLNTLSSVPSAALFILVTILASYFMSSDRREIRGFIYSQLPEGWSKSFPRIKHNAFTVVVGYVKAQLILMLLTFAEMCTGLLVIGSDYVLILSLLVALADAVPVLGTGLVMIPWIILELITGNVPMAFYIAILYASGLLIRYLVRPRIFHEKILLRPIYLLLAMYLGFYIFGIAGAVLAPILVLTIRSLQQYGTAASWKS